MFIHKNAHRFGFIKTNINIKYKIKMIILYYKNSKQIIFQSKKFIVNINK